MKKLQYIVVLIQGFLFLSFAQTNIPPGDVYGTWGINGSPYNIQGDITIPNDSTLTIEPGVLVEFQGYFALNVQGTLLALGTQTSKITFTINDTAGFHNPNTTLGGWNGIQFIDTPADNDSSKILFCTLQFGKAVGSSPPDNAGGAIFISAFNKVLISNCLITYNSAGGSDSPSGGGLGLHFANITLVENEISHNRAWDGGGIKIWESDPVFIGNLIDSNEADEGGGGIWIGGLSNCEFNYDIITNNLAGGNGGGIICWQTTITTLNSVNVFDNLANWGGGLGVIGCEMQINNCNIIDNAAISLGGGIGSDFSDVYISNTTFVGDTSGSLSGAIHSWYSDLQIKHCMFENNESDFGGGIHSDFSELQIDSCDFIVNKAIDGAAIHTLNTNLRIDSSRFFQNEATNIGAGIDYHIDTTDFINPYQIEIINSSFSENSAFYRGAVEIQQFNSETSLVDVKIDKCEFNDNAIDRGGNLLIAGYIQDFVISNSIFLENFAALRTPTCQFSNHVNGKVYNCLFTSNHTPGGGAASAVATGSKVNFINCTFASNSGGAALTLRNDSHSTLVNNIFWENENYNFILTAVTDSTPCSLNIDYCDIQYGLDSIVVNDTISVINWGLGNIDSDPLFVDILNNDFHLQDLSPCIAKGIDSTEIAGVWYYAPLTDIEGNPRPNPVGTMPDMGAYESQFPSRVEEQNLELPTEFSLSQNYPNPFNPTTKIRFTIPTLPVRQAGSPLNPSPCQGEGNRERFVTLKVYDVLGNEVATLVNEVKPAGEYEIEFNSHSGLSGIKELSSGIYFYQLKAGSFVVTKKMILLR